LHVWHQIPALAETSNSVAPVISNDSTVRQTFANCAKKRSGWVEILINSRALEVANKLRISIGNWMKRKFKVMSLPENKNTATDRTRINTEGAGRTSLRERVRQAAIETESEIIRETLERYRWNRRKTAEALRISYRSLMYKMKHCNLRDDEQADQLLER
jgi:DNA-binding NtrC family response regulator